MWKRVCLWQIHFNIWQNQYNIVKFKNKIKKERKKKKVIFSSFKKKKKGSGSWRQDRKNQRENTQSKEEGAVEKDICIVPPTIQFLMSETTGHKLKN